MGLPISVLACGPHARDPEAADAVARVMAELREVGVRLMPYRSDSLLSRLNRGELDLNACHPDVREVSQLCAAATRDMGGLFDPPHAGGRLGPFRSGEGLGGGASKSAPCWDA